MDNVADVPEREKVKEQLAKLFEQLKSGRAEVHLARKLRFNGIGDDEAFELQLIKPKIPDPKHSDRRPPCRFAYARSMSEALELLEQASHEYQWQGAYLVKDRLKPAVAAKVKPKLWYPSPGDGGNTTDKDIASRRIVYIDLDPHREDDVKDISATDAEQAMAVRLGCGVYVEMALVLRSTKPLGFMLSGNGCQAHLAVDLPNTDEVTRLVKEFLLVMRELYQDSGVVDVDTSVFDAKRIEPAPGTLKRKGANTGERKHRMVRFACEDNVERVGLDEFRDLVTAFKSRLMPEQLKRVQDELAGKKQGGSKPSASGKRRAVTPDDDESPFAAANALSMAAMMTALGLDPERPACPSCGAVGSRTDTGVAVLDDRVVKCLHTTCGQASYNNIGLVAKVVIGTDNTDKDNEDGMKNLLEATKWIAERFGTPMPGAKKSKEREAASTAGDDAVQQVLASLTFARTPIGRVFGQVDDAWWPVDSAAFVAKVARLYNTATGGKLVSKDSIEKALLPVLGSELPLRDVPIRMASNAGGVIVDLGDGKGGCIEIMPGSLQVLEKSPVPFFRPATMRALPRPEIPRDAPEAQAWLTAYRKLLGLEAGHNWHACLAWQLQVFRQGSTYTILRIKGAKGSGKTWKIKLLRRPLDPRRPELTSLPKDGEALSLIAENAHVLAFDNLRKIPKDMSDELCRLATFGGSEKRTLYETRGLSSFEAARPMILAGISDSVTEADLLDRAITITFERPRRRKKDEDIEREFVEIWPRVLGALCWVVSQGLAKLASSTSTITISEEVRMQEPCIWASACEEALGLESGSMERVYLESIEEASDVAREHPVLGVLLTWIERVGAWKGASKDLLEVLREEMTNPTTKRVKAGAPETERGVRALLDTHSHELARVGVIVSIEKSGRGAERRSVIRLRYAPDELDHVGAKADHVAVGERDPEKVNDVAAGSHGSRGSPREASLSRKDDALVLGAERCGENLSLVLKRREAT